MSINYDWINKKKEEEEERIFIQIDMLNIQRTYAI